MKMKNKKNQFEHLHYSRKKEKTVKRKMKKKTEKNNKEK